MLVAASFTRSGRSWHRRDRQVWRYNHRHFILLSAISGKTLAFGIPAISRVIKSPKSKGIQVLVVSPTRELAIQTHETLSDLGEPYGIGSVAIFGGLDKIAQIKALKNKKAKLVVGTPGRILDLVHDKALDLSG
jgi:ATP-dependent RNA helicase DBP3